MKKILGMGNTLVDIMVRVPDEKLLHEFELEKGGMRLVDAEFMQKLIKACEIYPSEKAPGGSAANTINGLANLGVATGFIGKVGNDINGTFMEDDMISNNISSLLLRGEAPTGVALALVTPDAERTFAVNLGCAIELAADDIHSAMFKGYSIFHIEGYLVQNHELLRTAVALAKESGVKVSLDLASFDVVRDNLDFLREILTNYVDIVFANEDEARAFTGKEPADALHALASLCEVAIVKTGKTGSMAKYEGVVHQIGILPATSIDTTGAGDMYAAGFLYGMVQGLTSDKCGQISALLAGKVIEVMGAKLPAASWKQINALVKEIEEE
jgi:sugar/nucleoside kinase (ribokinase family)